MEGNRCALCKFDENENSAGDASHEFSFKHKYNCKVFQWSNYRDSLVKDRHGIEVEVNPIKIAGESTEYTFNSNSGTYTAKLSIHQFLLKNCSIAYSFKVTNRSKETVNLMEANLIYPTEYFHIVDPQCYLEQGHIVPLAPAANYAFSVQFRLQGILIGGFQVPLTMSFQTANSDKFTITKDLVIIIGTNSGIVSNDNKGKSPFTSVSWPKTVTIIASNATPFNYMNPVPDHYKRVLVENFKQFKGINCEERQALEQSRKTLRAGHVTFDNYLNFFQLLLWLDEIALAEMLSKYNMENVKMVLKMDGVLELEVPGLAEKRPSLVKGDTIHIRIHADHTAYAGVISKINDATIEIEEVNMEFLEFMDENPDCEMDVEFQLGRLPCERMHQGVQKCLMHGMLPTLFPDPFLAQRKIPTLVNIKDSDFINEEVVSNVEQKTAVINIVNCSSRSAPYIVFGPPGTGKTVTIVEAILQIKKHHKQAKILVCAPANDTCDMLALKLVKHCEKKELIRVHSENRETEIPQNLLPYSNYADRHIIKVPFQDLADYRIVVTTLISSGRFVGKYWPDFVFIDEAAQALEPEACCAIGLMRPNRQLVLAGDPMQLGPVCGSHKAQRLGLGISLLARLMNTNKLYQDNNPNFITMLKSNFRSHPVAFTVPNELFYSGKLDCVNNSARNDPIAKIAIYPRILPDYEGVRAGEAVEFCGLNSKEKREGRSPSYFNELEIQVTMKYVNALLALNKEANILVEQEDIGIVTPYKRQMYRIKEQLKNQGLDEIEVGTAEVFQGREKRIIIITTVRAQQSLLLYDKKYDLGFVRSEKRFNVALTRAKSKLIVIGCPLVLRNDKNWTKFITLCEQLNVYFGMKFARSDDTQEHVLNMLDRVNFVDTQYSREKKQ